MKPTVFLDVDGIVADFHTTMYAAHGLKYDPENTVKGREGWEIDKLIGIPYPQLWPALTSDMVRTMPKTKEADTLVAALTPSNKPWHLVFLTSPMRDRIDARDQWLRERWPKINRIHTKVKSYCCNGISTLLIDDFDDNKTHWEASGGACILFPRPWNSRWQEEGGYFPHQFITEFCAWKDRALSQLTVNDIL